MQETAKIEAKKVKRVAFLLKLMQLFWISFKLGCTSFGGPTAHLGYFYNEYVNRRKWLTEQQYAELVALGQFLPGPASSQVGMGIGLLRGGMLGSVASFIGFTLPSVLLLVCFAIFYLSSDAEFGWLHGLKLVAVAIVLQAIIDMSRKLLSSWMHIAIAAVSLAAILLWPNPFVQIIVIAAAAIIGRVLLSKPGIAAGAVKSEADLLQNTAVRSVQLSKKTGAALLTFFLTLLILLPILARGLPYEWIGMFEKFYRAGALVFGGGHVVLPLLESEFVQSGFINAEDFIAGYGMTQAMPGPLFTFASYIGYLTDGWFGAVLATIAIFLPAFLLMIGAMPFWMELSRNRHARSAIQGINAAVIGILAAAFVKPIAMESIRSWFDAIAAILLFLLLIRWKIKPYWLVIIGLLIGLAKP